MFDNLRDMILGNSRPGAVVVLSANLSLALATTTLSTAPALSEPALELGKQVYQKANCIGCHKWHGGGGGGYGGPALSLRETPLDQEGLVEVIRCGRPATRMPYHDRNAYKSDDCYGTTRAEMGSDLPPKAALLLRTPEIVAVTAYVTLHLQGRGEPSKEDCVAFWGKDAKQCASMP